MKSARTDIYLQIIVGRRDGYLQIFGYLKDKEENEVFMWGWKWWWWETWDEMVESQSTLPKSHFRKMLKTLNRDTLRDVQVIECGRSQSPGVERDEEEEDHGTESD